MPFLCTVHLHLPFTVLGIAGEKLAHGDGYGQRTPCPDSAIVKTVPFDDGMFSGFSGSGISLLISLVEVGASIRLPVSLVIYFNFAWLYSDYACSCFREGNTRRRLRLVGRFGFLSKGQQNPPRHDSVPPILHPICRSCSRLRSSPTP